MGPKLHYGGTPSYISPDILLQIERSKPDDIWALGITMLFVSGLIPLPKHSWIIADIKEFEPKTMSSMRAWLLEIQRTCLRLPKSFSLLQCMLTENRAKRITASQLSTKLAQSLYLEISWQLYMQGQAHGSKAVTMTLFFKRLDINWGQMC